MSVMVVTILCSFCVDAVMVYLNVVSIDLSETEILACKHFSSYVSNTMSKYWIKTIKQLNTFRK